MARWDGGDHDEERSDLGLAPGCYKILPELARPSLIQRAIWRTWGLAVWFGRDRRRMKQDGWRKVGREWRYP